MSFALTQRQSRVLAVAILLVAVALAIAAIAVPALLLHQHYDRAIDDFVDHLQRYRRIAAQEPRWVGARDELRARDVRRFVLKNSAPNLAGAELQDMVRETIESNGGRIVTMQTPQPRDEEGFAQVGLNVQMFASTEKLQKILFALETQMPYLTIDSVSLRATAFRGYRPNPGVEPEVSVQMEVSALLLPQEARK